MFLRLHVIYPKITIQIPFKFSTGGFTLKVSAWLGLWFVLVQCNTQFMWSSNKNLSLLQKETQWSIYCRFH